MDSVSLYPSVEPVSDTLRTLSALIRGVLISGDSGLWQTKFASELRHSHSELRHSHSKLHHYIMSVVGYGWLGRTS